MRFMLCSKCGKKNEDGAQFCEYCGTKIIENNKSSATSKNNSNKILVICGICAVVLIFIVCLMCFKFKSDFQFSELKYINDDGLIYIYGKVKNNTDNDCDTLTVEYKYESGDFSDTGYMWIDDVPRRDVKDILDMTFDVEEYNYEDYKISVIGAECKN